MGFFNNPKRFNVAITRAQALLVVVGHPDMLKSDRQWGHLVRFDLPAAHDWAHSCQSLFALALLVFRLAGASID